MFRRAMNLDEMIENSFRNLHVKGFDYLCLKRTPDHTRKVYFFDGRVSQLPEVINPHDHRYDFTTTVLSGVMSNSVYREDAEGEVYNEFRWDTPLNGGAGFAHQGERRLVETRRYRYQPGEVYHMDHRELHTIRMHKEGTVIVLDQFDDKVPVGVPTRTFMKDKQAPSLDGLYERFTPDQLLARLGQLNALLPPSQRIAA